MNNVPKLCIALLKFADTMQKTLIVTALFALFPVIFCWVKLELIHRLFLVFSNFAMIPALKQAFKHRAWFESSFILMMGSISMVYHALFDLTEFWGGKFRHGDWVLALTAPYVLLHYVFRRENSEFKTIANFWALFTSYFLATYFQDHILIYSVILTVYSVGLIYLRSRHFCAIPVGYMVWTLALMTAGVVLFVVSDYTIYWLLHTYWHFAAFASMYWVIKIGPSGTADCEKPRLPTTEAGLGQLLSTSAMDSPHPFPTNVTTYNGLRFDF